MRLKMLREHYQSTDSGNTWQPKRKFESITEVRQEGFYPNKWRVYKCGQCDFYHVASLSKKDDTDER